MSDDKKSNKLDVQAILGNIKNIKNIKNMLPQNIGTPKPVNGDTLGQALADLSEKSKQASKAQADLTQTLYDIEQGINALFADIETLRGELASAGVGADTATESEVKTKKSSKAKAAAEDEVAAEE